MRTDRDAIVSPDGEYAAFIRDFNRWLRDVETSAEKPLTTDGIEDLGCAICSRTGVTDSAANPT